MIHTLTEYNTQTILDALYDAERHATEISTRDHQSGREIWLQAVRSDLRTARNLLLSVALTDVEVESIPPPAPARVRKFVPGEPASDTVDVLAP